MAPGAIGQPTFLRGLWYRWKSLKLPWRSTYLIGQDLSGNTFWEFKNQLNPGRPRRIARYPPSTHYGDVKLTPSWLQWLRHTRAEAPTLEEQQLDVTRQDNLKQLAAQADARWAAKESYLDRPQDTAQPSPQLQPRDKGGYGGPTEDSSRQGVRSMVGDDHEVAGAREGKDVDKGRFKGETSDKDSPWARWKAQKKGTPSDSWQPEPWTPGKAAPR